MKLLRLPYFLILVLFVLVIVISALTMVSSRLSGNMQQIMKESNIALTRNTVSLFLEQNRESLQKVVYDYTFWDELVRFAVKKDTVWAHENLNPMLRNFRLDGIWVINTNRNLVFSCFSEAYSTLANYRIPEAVVSRLEQNKFLHYFTKTPHGILEFQAATIHPTKDEGRQSPPQGYFLVCRGWDDSFFSGLEDIIGGHVSLSREIDRLGSQNAGNREIHFYLPLVDYDSSMVSYLVVDRESDRQKDYHYLSKMLLVVQILSSAVVLLLILVAFKFHRDKQVSLIRESLITHDPKIIESLINIGGPLAEIGLILKKGPSTEDNAEKPQEQRIQELNEEYRHQLSHKVRTPLSSLIGFCELYAATTDPVKKELFLKYIRTSSMNLLKVVDEGFDFPGKIDPKYYYSLKEEDEKYRPKPSLDVLGAREIDLVLLEDDHDNAVMIQETLSDRRFHIHHFVNGAEGLEYIRKNRTSLVLMDVKIPGMSGWEAARKIKMLNPDLPVIIQTAYASEADRQHAGDIGCDDYLAKPYTPEELLRIILHNLPHS